MVSYIPTYIVFFYIEPANENAIYEAKDLGKGLTKELPNNLTTSGLTLEKGSWVIAK
ncbi:hypothetical protein VSA01S_23510 [Vibrio sagamiensis NBRC 104589]|uniref:Uncharacterized protein n=1 Tax=Vibrio sagamiensis NBRC 104589 TaxID=1219064 RepID=A0A511QG05_9VIBR|nr:hypothetical protein VSA01S_23510 [Vibrio sagamiensis NBRC 104589]